MVRPADVAGALQRMIDVYRDNHGALPAVIRISSVNAETLRRQLGANKVPREFLGIRVRVDDLGTK